MKNRRQNRINRIADRVKGIILEDPQQSLGAHILKERHPITWRLLLEKLTYDRDESIRNSAAKALNVEPLLGPGDEPIDI